jgi:hypothetical protein
MMVVLFWPLGKYLAEVTPDPREAESAFGLLTDTP